MATHGAGCGARRAPAGGRRRGIAVLAALALSSALARPLAGQYLQFRHLGLDDGIALSWVQGIMQDHQGFMWFATGNGLVRHDGYSFKVFRNHRNDTTTIADHRVNAVLEDQAGVLWAATRVGFSRFDRATERFTNYTADGQVNTLAEDSQGTLWIGAGSGLYRFDRAHGRAVAVALPVPSGSDPGIVEMLFEDSRQHLWIGTRNYGLFELDPAAHQIVRVPLDTADPRAADQQPRAMAEDLDGRLWVATYHAGLIMLDPRTGQRRRYTHDPRDANSLAINSVLRVINDGRGGLWIGTENGGLDHLDPRTGTFHHYGFVPGDRTSLSSNSVWSLFRDRAGTLWVGTFSGGVNITKQNSAAIRSYRSVESDPTSLSYNTVTAFAEDAQGTVWIATDGGGLDRFDPGTGRFARYTTHNSNLDRDAVLGVATDREGGVWLGTWGGGLNRFDPVTHRFTAYTTRNSNIAEDNIFSVYEDRHGRLWVGTWQSGLLLFDRAHGSFTRFRIAEPAETESQIWQIRELHDGRLALGTLDLGLAIFDPATGSVQRYRSDPRDDNTLSSLEVRGTLETTPGRLWVATSNGLDHLDLASNRVTHVTDADGLPANGIAGITADRAGRLWVSTDQGLARFDTAAKHVDVFTTEDGLQGTAFTQRAYLRASDGALYFGGNNGFTVVRPELLQSNHHRPPVVLTGFRLLARPVVIGGRGSPLQADIGLTDQIRLSHNQNVFSLEFAALDYVAPAKNRYAYRLDGIDQEWRYVGTTRTASYAGLPPGRYVFRVKASNNDGVWNEAGTSLLITIAPPFWQTWWFRTLALLMTVGGSAAVIGNARRRHRYLADNVLEILAAMRRSASGDHSVALPVRTGDEIGELRQGINTVLAERNRAEEELRQSQKMEAVGRLAGGVAHDFNNLLTVIKGNAALVLGGLRNGDAVEAVEAELEEVQRAADRAESLTRQLLAFSRKQILQPRVLSLNDVVHDLGRMLRRSLGEDVELRTVLDPELGRVRADRGQIEQVLLNLVVNARDAMPRGGVLTIETANVDDAEDPICPSGRPHVALIVHDTGCGIPPEVRNRVFEPFFTTKEPGKGTGLGLATVYGIVTQSEGEVHVESEPGHGATFTVYLPRVEAAESPGEERRPEAFAPGSGTVLLVEDEDALRRLAARVLSRQGYQVLAAASGEEALRIARGHAGTIELLLTDVVMPGMSGRELSERLVALFPDMSRVYMSGYTEDDIVRHGVTVEGTAFLGKPFTPADLLRKLEDVLGTSRSRAAQTAAD